MKKNPQAFVNQLLVCLLVTMGFGGSLGLGTVWMRHQISATANLNRVLKADWERVERLIDEKKTVIETAQAPEKLRALNLGMRLGLVPMSEVSIVHVTDNTTDRLAARATRDSLIEASGRKSVPIAFKVAKY
ncbi:MAG: hypothetical protein RL077_4814 [Verrucomicrobiota bacterium]|jgi:hypothetical protein